MTVCSGQSTIAAVRSYSVSVTRDASPTRWLCKVKVDGVAIVDVFRYGTRSEAVRRVIAEHPEMSAPCRAMMEGLASDWLHPDDSAETESRFGS